MRRVAITGVVLFAVLIAAAPVGEAAGARQPAPKCPPAHWPVLVADAQAQLYVHPALVVEPFTPEEVYGCTYETRRSYELGQAPGECGGGEGGCGGVEHEVLAGPVVAYERFAHRSGVHPFSDWEVLVRNLRTGKIMYREPTGTRSVPSPNDVGAGATVAMVVKSDGAVAWILKTNADEGLYQVHAVDKSGSRLLASGSDVDPHSLALAGSTLYWTQGGQPFSAPLN
jgi:hypothetical protein